MLESSKKDSMTQRVHSIETFYGLCAGVSAIVIAIILVLALIVNNFAGPTWGPILGTLLGLALAAIFVDNSLQCLDASVPEKAMPMILGTFVNRLIGPGYIFVPFRGVLTSYLVMFGGEVNPIFPVQALIPGDKSTVKIPNDYYASIDPNNPAQIIEVGGLNKAILRLNNLIIRRERYWITSVDEGPQDLDQARRMSEEVNYTILEELLKGDVRRIPSEIPTEVLYGIYKDRLLAPKEREWKETKFDTLSEDEQRKIMRVTKEHLEFIRDLRNNKRPIVLNYLGLIIRGFGTDNIEPSENTAENTEALNAEYFLAKRRKVNAEGLAEAAKILKEVPGVQGDPIRIIQINEGLVKESVNVNRGELSSPLITLAQELLTPLVSAFTGKLSKEKE